MSRPNLESSKKRGKYYSEEMMQIIRQKKSNPAKARPAAAPKQNNEPKRQA
jgi:hypothetical protein